MMKKLHFYLPAILIAGCSGLMMSCAPEACLEETISFLKASFYSNTTKQKAAPDSLTLFGLSLQANKIYNKAAQVQPALFPLNVSADSCTFVIKINGVTDTIHFLYSSFPHLISKECGYTFYHTLDTFFYSKNTIDYIYRSSDNITTLNEENIRIFY
jgi:uncharacterized protein YfaT (DUF1175 family)